MAGDLERIAVIYHEELHGQEDPDYITYVKKALRYLRYTDPLFLNFQNEAETLESEAEKYDLMNRPAKFVLVLYGKDTPRYLCPDDGDYTGFLQNFFHTNYSDQDNTKRDFLLKYKLFPPDQSSSTDAGGVPRLLFLNYGDDVLPNAKPWTTSDGKATHVLSAQWKLRADRPTLNFATVFQIVFDPYRKRNTVQSNTETLAKTLLFKDEPTDGSSTTTVDVSEYDELSLLFKETVEKYLIDELGIDQECQTEFLKLLTSVAKGRPILTGLSGWTFAFNVIRAMTMARRLASWSLEGEKFNCWIKLVDASDEVEGMFANAHRLFSSNSNIHFDISNEKEVREIAEMAIGDSVFLHVDWNTNRIQSVYSHKTVYSNNPMVNTCRKEKSYIAIHVRSDERVEIFNKEGMSVLIWDGFRWKPNPVRDLEDALTKFYFEDKKSGKEIDKDETQRNNNLIRILTDTGARLLDGGYSSIFILVHDKDRDKDGPVWGDTLRSDLLPPKGLFKPLNIAKIGDSALFTILKLDGAHFIDSSGRLFKICGNLANRNSAWHDCSLTSKEKDSCSLEEGATHDIIDESSKRIGEIKRKADSLLIINDVEIKGFIPPLIKYLLSGSCPCADLLIRSLELRKDTPPGESKDTLYLDIEVKDSLYVQPPENFNWAPREVFCQIRWKGSRIYKQFYVTVDVAKIEEALDLLKKSRWEYAPATMQVLSQWMRSGNLSGRGNSGTGTRAALATSAKMPESLVVKVSASGKIMVYKGGYNIPTSAITKLGG